MAEYIEREALIERLKRRRDSERFPKTKYAGLESAIFQVKHLPAADVVEVVRCGECIHRGNLQECDGKPLDWYCPNGVRKGEGE